MKLILNTKIIFLILGVLLTSIVLVSIYSSTKGTTLIALEEELMALERQNRELSAQVVELTALSQIQEQSEALGMIKPEVILYLENAEPIARLP